MSATSTDDQKERLTQELQTVFGDAMKVENDAITITYLKQNAPLNAGGYALQAGFAGMDTSPNARTSYRTGETIIKLTKDQLLKGDENARALNGGVGIIDSIARAMEAEEISNRGERQIAR